MDTKLTLKLDIKIIKRAKLFAQKNHTSLSSLVENYFSSLGQKDNDLPELSVLPPAVKSLAGAIKIKDSQEPGQLREDYLAEKYIHD